MKFNINFFLSWIRVSSLKCYPMFFSKTFMKKEKQKKKFCDFTFIKSMIDFELIFVK